MAETASASWFSAAPCAKSCVAIWPCACFTCRPGEGAAAVGLAAACAAAFIWRCCAASSRCVGCGILTGGGSMCEELAAAGRVVIGNAGGAAAPAVSKVGPPGESKNCEGEKAIVGESSALGDAEPQIWLMAFVVLSGPAGLSPTPLLPSRRLVLVGVLNVGTRIVAALGRPGVPRVPNRPEKSPGDSGSSASEKLFWPNSNSVPKPWSPRLGDASAPTPPSILRRLSRSAASSRAGEAARLRRGL